MNTQLIASFFSRMLRLKMLENTRSPQEMTLENPMQQLALILIVSAFAGPINQSVCLIFILCLSECNRYNMPYKLF